MQSKTDERSSGATSFRRFLVVVFVVIAAACSNCAVADESPADIDRPEFIRIAIPLKDSQYTLHDWLRESNEKLGTRYDLSQIDDKKYPLNPRRLRFFQLLLAAVPGEVRPRLSREGDNLVFELPDPESPDVRRAARELYEKWFGELPDRWPPEKGLQSPKTIDPARRSVVFVHGLEAKGDAFDLYRKLFGAADVQILAFDYPNDGPLADAGERFRRDLLELQRMHPRLELTIVAHSMGGLVSRYALEAEGTRPQNVRHLFLLGTPHAGSNMAKFQLPLELLVQVLPDSRSLKSIFEDGMGEAAVDLRPGSRFLAELNARPRPPFVKYHVAYGTRALVSGFVFDQLADRLENFLEDRDFAIARRTNLIGQFQEIRELVHGEGDGAVLVSSARLDDVATTREFALNHLELLDPIEGRQDAHPVVDWILETLNWNRPGGSR